MSTTETRTETRTVVQTEEVELTQCPGCEQFHEADELVPVLLNVDSETVGRYDDKILNRRNHFLCRYCIKATWEYNPIVTGDLRHQLYYRLESRVDTARRLFWKALPLVVGLLIVGLVAALVLGEVASAVDAASTAAETSEPAFQGASEDVATEPGPVSIANAFLPLLILSAVFVALGGTLLNA